MHVEGTNKYIWYQAVILEFFAHRCSQTDTENEKTSKVLETFKLEKQKDDVYYGPIELAKKTLNF